MWNVILPPTATRLVPLLILFALTPYSPPVACAADRPVRLRRASTRLTPVDKIISHYEESLREHASLEKLFKYFASKVVHGRELMTPVDFVRAITPGVPPSPFAKPINIPVFESDPSALSELEVPPFFRFLPPDDLGLISFGRFLILLALLAVPAEQLDVMYHMNSGKSFKNPALRSEGLTVNNLDFIITRHIKTREQGYDPQSLHSHTSILRFLFGPNLDKTLSLEALRDFHRQLISEVEKIEYFLLGDKKPNAMSLLAFAKSVSALVPLDRQAEFQKRAQALADATIPPEFLPEDYANSPAPITVNDWIVSFDDYSHWKEVVKSLELMESAVKLYSHEDGSFSPTNFVRAAKAVAGVEISQPLCFVLFALFDVDSTGRLERHKFVDLLQRHCANAAPAVGPDGLQLAMLARCMVGCGRGWLMGTLKD